MRRSGQNGQHSPSNDTSELKVAAYLFARRGIVGVFLWIFQRKLNDALARHFTIGAAIATWLGALGLLALANRTELAMLKTISVYAVLAIPVLGLVAWVLRQQRGALAAEHGRDSEAFEAAIESGHEEASKTIMEDDWILDPPWRRPDTMQRPRFGRKKE